MSTKMPYGRVAQRATNQMMHMVIQQVVIFIRGRNGYKMTKKRSMAMEVSVNVETYTDVPCGSQSM